MRAVIALSILIIIGCCGATMAPPPHSSAATEIVAPSNKPTFPLQAFAIFTAVAIFLARESLEARRRHNTRTRQLAVLKANLARQCEFNNWSYRSLKSTVGYVRGSLEENDGDVFKLSFLRNGSVRLTVVRVERGHAGMMLPKVRVEDFEARLMQAAELDPVLQGLADEAAAASAEMLHVRDSLISYILKEDDDDGLERPDDIFLGFTEYAGEELERTYAALNALYSYCTGKQLTAHRLR